MSSINNINNNNHVINVGRTTPVTPGPQSSDKSIPVVVATDQQAVPIEEQNKIQSEVALSLLGIPRSEVALGIFADVNTYDINPSEWSFEPQEYSTIQSQDSGLENKSQGWGIKHLPEESGALIEAAADQTSILTSKRFFRYQPGRVSSATFGIKSSTALGTTAATEDGETARTAIKNPTIKKAGIFDKFDGYYWETRDTAQGDQFAVVRRTQSIIRFNPLKFGNSQGEQTSDHALAGKPPVQKRIDPTNFQNAITNIKEYRHNIISIAFDDAVDDINNELSSTASSYLQNLSESDQEKCKRDMDFAVDAYINDLKWGGNAHSIVNATTYRTANLNNTEAESFVHEKLKDQIISRLQSLDESEAADKISFISTYTINAVSGTQPTTTELSEINYGARPKIETIFSVYKNYLAYLVSESMTYTANTSEEEEIIKYKCLRDVKFIIEAYANDVQNGGNSNTIYNAKRYYYLANGRSLQVYTQTSGGIIAEIARHEYLKNLISSSDDVDIVVNGTTTGTSIASVVDLFGLSNTRTKFQDLSNIIIDNFESEYQGAIDFGNSSVPGDLIIYRDGLIMTHAAVYDPSLLKEKNITPARANSSNNTLTLGAGDIRIGQYVNYYGDAGGLVDGKTYFVTKVSGTKGNIIELADPADINFSGITSNTVNITNNGTTNKIETPVPFVFSDEYDNEFDTGALPRYDGMFPYLYTDTGILPEDVSTQGITSVGFIDTAIDTNTNPEKLQEQIDTLNLLYTGWVRDHVDPEFWSVYEYRVPRSRFSGDSLNSQSRKEVYSDEVSTNRPGERVLQNGEFKDDVSVWDFDFTKVSMLKIEFSWYGAVGALFLAYVPVGNGEARWVRVHHLRCSNQLKISSLGNATLPITYLVYGGGSEKRLGIPNNLRLQNQYDSSYSEFIVKYGASYYIDGGDRGTVRLNNHSSEIPTDIYGSRYTFSDVDSSNANNVDTPYFTINTLPSGYPAISTYYIGGNLITGNSQDQSVEITWIDGNRVYLNKPVSQVNSFDIIVNRPSIIYGLESKRNIISGDGVEVRNRVQVYPTLMSIGASGNTNAKLSLLKTPLFQSFTPTTGNLNITADTDISLTNEIPVSNTNYLTNNGDFTYGYFQGYTDNTNKFISILGKLEKQNNLYYFYPTNVFSGSIILRQNSSFLKEGIFDSQGTEVTEDPDTFSKERLSSIKISNKVRSPIPKTGSQVSTFFISPGAEKYDLSPYFDYNKEYISFPLTDNIETLYLVSSSTANNSTNSLLSISASVTWEEQ